MKKINATLLSSVLLSGFYFSLPIFGGKMDHQDKSGVAVQTDPQASESRYNEARKNKAPVSEAAGTQTVVENETSELDTRAHPGAISGMHR